MKHIFVINPAAGKKDSSEDIMRAVAAIPGYDCEFYVTQGPRDATRYVKTWLEEHNGVQARFYACGGDGTLNEVVNGVVGFDNASVGMYPSGSGDDFVKYYGGRDNFLDFKKLLDAPEDEIDLLTVDNGKPGEFRYSINITNFGFDTTVAKTMIKVKRKKIIGGKHAYVTGVLTGLIKAMRNKCEITADGERVDTKGRILLCTLANGGYVGGGFFCAPRSINNDGLIEVTAFRPLSRITFVRLVGSYTNGTHLDDARFQKYITYRRAKEVSVKAPEGFSMSVDGEIVDGTEFTSGIAKKAVRFAVPEGCVLIAGRNGETVGAAPAKEEEAPAEPETPVAEAPVEEVVPSVEETPAAELAAEEPASV